MAPEKSMLREEYHQYCVTFEKIKSATVSALTAKCGYSGVPLLLISEQKCVSYSNSNILDGVVRVIVAVFRHAPRI